MKKRIIIWGSLAVLIVGLLGMAIYQQVLAYQTAQVPEPASHFAAFLTPTPTPDPTSAPTQTPQAATGATATRYDAPITTAYTPAPTYAYTPAPVVCDTALKNSYTNTYESQVHSLQIQEASAIQSLRAQIIAAGGANSSAYDNAPTVVANQFAPSFAAAAATLQSRLASIHCQ
ncbi:hypothetical protein HJC99_01225 [Candidatus Saccharibacteria bacterium]|nr:hypothetical protein [Candidatus Saccharibacteria bacterium]